MEAVLASLDGVSEPMRAEYELIGDGHPLANRFKGKYLLKVTATNGLGSGLALEDVTGLKSALSAERTKAQGLEQRLTAYGDLAPEQAKELSAKLKTMESWTPDERVKAQLDNLKAQLSEKHRAELEGTSKTLAQREKEIEELLIGREAVEAITAAKGQPKLLLPHVKTACKVQRTSDGKLSVVVLDESGNPMLSRKPGNSNNMTITEFVETLRGDDAFAGAFAATGARGSGAGQPPRNGTGGSSSSHTHESGGEGLSAVDRLREARRNGMP